MYLYLFYKKNTKMYLQIYLSALWIQYKEIGKNIIIEKSEILKHNFLIFDLQLRKNLISDFVITNNEIYLIVE